jgi:hypothetical protein
VVESYIVDLKAYKLLIVMAVVLLASLSLVSKRRGLQGKRRWNSSIKGLLVSQGCTPRCWETFVTLIDLVSLLLQREKLYMLISSCSAVQAADRYITADGCTRAKTLF